MINQVPDLELVQACQNGQLNSFSNLYDRYVKKIYDFVYYRTHHRETSQDLVSQTFFKALKNIDSFDLNQGSFSAWLYRIAHNNLLDHYRSQKPELDIEDFVGLSDDTDIEGDINKQEEINQVKKYLQKLDKRQQDIIIMRIWDELSYQEIADILSLSPDNCKMIFSRSLQQLKKMMPLNLFIILLLNL